MTARRRRRRRRLSELTDWRRAAAAAAEDAVDTDAQLAHLPRSNRQQHRHRLPLCMRSVHFTYVITVRYGDI